MNAVAPGVVKTPIWTEDKLRLVDEEKGSFPLLFPVSPNRCEEWLLLKVFFFTGLICGVDTWVAAEKIAEVMLDLVQGEENVGGTVLEVGAERVRMVESLMDPGPEGKGHDASNARAEIGALEEVIWEEFRK